MQVPLNRLVALLILAVILVMAGRQTWIAFGRPWDGTDFRPCKSRVYLANGFSETGESHGRAVASEQSQLLVSVDGKPVETLEDVRQALGASSKSQKVDLKLWNPAVDRSMTVSASLDDLEGRLKEIPPAVWIASVNSAGQADEAGVRDGDLIIAVNGEKLGQYNEPDPFFKLMRWLYSLAGFAVEPTHHADLYIRRSNAGDSLIYDVFRDGKIEQKTVNLVQGGLHFPMGLFISIGFFTLFYGGWALLRQPFDQHVSALMVALGYILLIIIGRSADYGASAVIRDLGLLIPFLASLAVVKLPRGEVGVPGWVWGLRERLRPGEFRQPHAWEAALSTAALILLIVLLGALYPGRVPDWVEERVINPGLVSQVIFALLAWVFLFGGFYLVGVLIHLLAPSSPGEERNARLSQAISEGPAKKVAKLLRKDRAIATAYYGLRTQELLQLFRTTPERHALESLANELIDRDQEDAHHAFSVLRWCEVALPLLGFLGTVVGIAWALPRMSAVIGTGSVPGSATTEVLAALRLAFQDLGLAFDTTLVGLVGLLVVGVLHHLVDRRLGIQFAQARTLLQKYVSLLRPTSVAAELALLGTEVAAIQGSLAANQAERSRLLGALELLITDGNTQPWQEMRRILSRTTVSFDSLGAYLWAERKKFLQKAGLTNWECLAVADGGSSGVAVGLIRARDDDRRHLLRFIPDGRSKDLLRNVEVPNTIHRLVSSPSGRHLVALGDDQGMVELTLPEKDEPLAVRPVAARSQPNEQLWRRVWGFQVGAQDLLLVAETTGSTTSLWYTTFGGESSRMEVSDGTAHVWPSFSFHPQTGTFVAESSEQGRPVWKRFRLRKAQGMTPSDEPTLVLEADGMMEASHELNGAKIFFLSGDQVLLNLAMSKRASRNYFLDFRNTTPNQLDGGPDWPERIIEVQASGSWIAVRDSDYNLSMWRLMLGGGVEPYEEAGRLKKHSLGAGLPTGSDRLVPTSDGRYLLAASGNSIGTWTYPRRAMDALRGEARHA